MSSLTRHLLAMTGLSPEDFAKIVATAPQRYKQYRIPKRSGGWREIAQPARELKLIQRALVEILLADLPVHAAARAYKKGSSIRDNAKEHAGDTPILKMDFENFFPSIKASDWQAYCRKFDILDQFEITLTTSLLFRLKPREVIPKLSIGAPSSPILSNILMFEFDEVVTREADKRGISYTRYADDLTFSGQRIGMLSDMQDVVRRAIRAMKSPKLRVNARKTKFITSAHRRVVTGVILANDGALTIGRDRKRLIRSKLDYASRDLLDDGQLRELAGELAFVNVVEPQFIDKLRDWYGWATVERVKKMVEID